MPRTVVLTRAPEDNAALATALRGRGHEVIELPCVATAALEDDRALAAAVAALGPHDHLVVTSVAGARAVADVLREPPPARVSTVGARAASLLRELGIAVERSEPTGAALAERLPIPRGIALLARSDRALPDLPEILRARGATVREVVAYRTIARVEGDRASAARAFAAGAAVVVASPSAVEALVAAIGEQALGAARVIATGPTTAARVRALTGREATLATWHELPGVLA